MKEMSEDEKRFINAMLLLIVEDLKSLVISANCLKINRIDVNLYGGICHIHDIADTLKDNLEMWARYQYCKHAGIEIICEINEDTGLPMFREKQKWNKVFNNNQKRRAMVV
jgi:hypothetical protein